MKMARVAKNASALLLRNIQGKISMPGFNMVGRIMCI